MTALNNYAYFEHRAGEHERAWDLIEKMRAAAATRGYRLDPSDLDTVASVQIALGRYAEAERTVLEAIAAYPGGYQEADALPEFLLTLATARRLRGAVVAAQAALAECRALCAHHGHDGIMVRVQQEQAELYAATGEWQLAFEEHRRFHAAESEARGRQRETQARIRQELFEVNEARQEAERFREQARRDPLTGLRNRRHIDEVLPGLIAQAVSSDLPLWAAVLDLDHFKQINDRLSHEAGDRVLEAVGGLLADAVAAPGFAARLGGEEFLLVVPGLGPAETLAFLERVRRAVADRDWPDHPVTISIGAARVTAGATQSTLLARADEQLYEAKRAGRNRVRMAAAQGPALRPRR